MDAARLDFERDLEAAQELGSAVHALVATVAADHGGAATPAQVLHVSRRLGFGTLPPVYRQSARQRVVTAAATYFRRFGRPLWRFAGAEKVVGDVALDLLWSRAGTLEADEVKSGASASLISLTSVRRQVDAQVVAARAEFGSAFTGVRAVLLADPDRSFFVSARGDRP